MLPIVNNNPAAVQGAACFDCAEPERPAKPVEKISHHACVPCAVGYCYLDIGLNIALALIAVVVGMLADSRALVVSSLFSVSAVITAVAALVGLRGSAKIADESHPYDYGKSEFVAMLGGSVALVIGMLATFFYSMFDVMRGAITAPNLFSLVVCAGIYGAGQFLSLRGDEVAPGLNSPSLRVSAEQNRLQSYCGIAVALAILGSVAGMSALDRVTAIFLVLFLSWFAGRAFAQGVKGLMDTALDPDVEARLRQACRGQGATDVVALRTRQSGSIPWADIVVSLRPEVLLPDAHAITARIKEKALEILGTRARVQIGFRADVEQPLSAAMKVREERPDA